MIADNPNVPIDTSVPHHTKDISIMIMTHVLKETNITAEFNDVIANDRREVCRIDAVMCTEHTLGLFSEPE
jgi:hypothetical protein